MTVNLRSPYLYWVPSTKMIYLDRLLNSLINWNTFQFWQFTEILVMHDRKFRNFALVLRIQVSKLLSLFPWTEWKDSVTSLTSLAGYFRLSTTFVFLNFMSSIICVIFRIILSRRKRQQEPSTFTYLYREPVCDNRWRRSQFRL